MEEKENNLQEQQAPLKNSDDAFVQVGKDGAPVMPETTEQKATKPEPDRTTTLDKR
jgi:hypothetical protein